MIMVITSSVTPQPYLVPYHRSRYLFLRHSFESDAEIGVFFVRILVDTMIMREYSERGMRREKEN